MLRALIVDDNAEFVGFMRTLLCERFAGAVIQDAPDAAGALRLLSAGAHDIVVVDIALKGPTNGLALLARMRERGPRPPIIMLTNYAMPEYQIEAERLGADLFLPKAGFTSEEILSTIAALTSARI
jgi:DNA-binding NarL/FixJ family response regulator